MIHTLAISNYRSLRDIVVPLERINVVTGANGSGKSSLYRSMRLLADVANGSLFTSLANEGGFASTLWAGPEKIARGMRSGEFPVQGTVRDGPVALRLGFSGAEYSYSIELGQPVPLSGSAFNGDPEIKREVLWIGEVARPANIIAERTRAGVRSRMAGGTMKSLEQMLQPYDCMLVHCADPHQTPEIMLVREQMRQWRFYDQFRTDRHSPMRTPQVGTRTPVLDHEGRDLAAAIRTIQEIGDQDGFQAALDDAFPGSSLRIDHDGTRFDLQMGQQGLLRPLSAAELSDGTIR